MSKFLSLTVLDFILLSVFMRDFYRKYSPSELHKELKRLPMFMPLDSSVFYRINRRLKHLEREGILESVGRYPTLYSLRVSEGGYLNSLICALRNPQLIAGGE
jgi:hypothetical protein